MSKEIPQSKRVQVVRLYLEGLSLDGIAAKLGISKGSAVAIVGELRERKFPQFDNVADMVDGMRELAVTLQKLKITAAEAANLILLARRFIDLGVGPSQLESWILMCRSVGEDALARGQVLEAAAKLAKLEAEGLPYEDVLERLRSSAAELSESQRKLEELRSEVAQLRETEQNSTRVCQRLDDDRKRLETENHKLVEKGQQLSDRCSKLEKRILDQQSDLSQLEEKHKSLSESLTQAEEQAAALEKKATERTLILKDLENLGFSREDLEKLRTGLVDMGRRYGRQDLATRLFEYLTKYDDLLALEAAKQDLAGEVDKLTGVMSSLAQFGEKLGLTPGEVAEGVAALKALRKSGVTPSAVTSYQKVLSSSGLEPESFQKLVTVDFRGVEQMLVARRTELDAKKREIETRCAVLEELKGEEAKVKESITVLRESTVKEVTDMAVRAKAEVDKLCQDMREDIVKWGSLRSEIGKYEDQLRTSRYFTGIPLSQEALNSLVSELAAPIILQYLTISRAWCNRRFNPKHRPPPAIVKKYHAIHDYTPVELADVVTWAIAMFVGGTAE